VDLFGEGFDVPAVECVIMARPTASLVIYLQQFGRALRTMPGKQFGLIIDMVSNWKRHGYPDKPRVWDLERREKKTRKEKDPEDVELVLCKNERCLKPYEKFMTFCPHCGHVPEITPQSRSSPEFVDGDLILLDRQTLAQLRDAANLSSPQMVAERVALAAGEKAGVRAHKNQEERIREQQALSDAIAQWAGVQRWKGREDRESHKRFYYAAGMTVLEALAMPKSDMEKMREKVEQWINL
jgi:superfamily II DNA or RNA helicase